MLAPPALPVPAAPVSILSVTRLSGAPPVRIWAEVMRLGLARTTGVPSRMLLVTSPDPVLYTWYAPSVSVAPVLRNDCPRAVSAVANSLLYTAARARMPRFTLRNVAGVSNPANPLPSANEKAAPAGPRWVLASSRSDPLLAETAALAAIGPGAPVGSATISITAPLASRVTITRRSSSASIVLANPRSPSFWASVSPTTLSVALSTITAFRILAYRAAQKFAPKAPEPGSSGP